MQSANPKLYLILECCDSGGYNILKVRSTIDECVEWLDQNPVNIPYGTVARVTGCDDPVYFDVLPVLFVATEYNKQTQNKDVISSPMDEPTMRQWLAGRGAEHPYYCLSPEGTTYPYINMWMAESKAQTEAIGGKFESIQAVPHTCRISEEPAK